MPSIGPVRLTAITRSQSARSVWPRRVRWVMPALLTSPRRGSPAEVGAQLRRERLPVGLVRHVEPPVLDAACRPARERHPRCRSRSRARRPRRAAAPRRVPDLPAAPVTTIVRPRSPSWVMAAPVLGERRFAPASTLAAASARGNRFGDVGIEWSRHPLHRAPPAERPGAVGRIEESARGRRTAGWHCDLCSRPPPSSRAPARSRSSPARARASAARAPRRSPQRARASCSPGCPTLEPERAAAELVAQGLEAFGVACDVTDAAQLRRLVDGDRAEVGPDRHGARERRRRARPARRGRRARAHGPDVRAARACRRRARRAHPAGHRRRRRGSVPHHVEPVGPARQPRAVGLRRDEGGERAARPQHRGAVGCARSARQRDLARRDRDRVRRADHRAIRMPRPRDSRRPRSAASALRPRSPAPWSGSPRPRARS